MNDVEFGVHRGVGRIRLNRPKAINALTHGMVRAITERLEAWRDDDQVRVVVLDGAGERGLCAGGDIRSIYQDARHGGGDTLAFWADEYRLNALIARYPKPYLAIMDGIVMGGGVGVSAHGSHRVVTERSRVAMPEVGIGFVPDVGGTFLLSRAPGRLGTHLALTGAAMSGADAIHCGFADRFVPNERLPELITALGTATPDEALDSLSETPPESELAGHRPWIDDCYAADTVAMIIDRLRAGPPAAVAAAAEIGRKSPTAVTVALRAVRTAATLPDLESVLMQEFRVSRHALRTADLVEGIRAQIIDKDQAPDWQPATLAGVGEEAVAAYFTGAEHDDLTGVTR